MVHIFVLLVDFLTATRSENSNPARRRTTGRARACPPAKCAYYSLDHSRGLVLANCHSHSSAGRRKRGVLAAGTERVLDLAHRERGGLG